MYHVKKQLRLFKEIGDEYKLELIEAIPEDEQVSIYEQGDFVDLCRGVHVPSTGKLKEFKLLSIAGAYWRGDSDNKMLQRIYGTAFFKKEDLKAHLKMLEEAKERDHRKIGKELRFIYELSKSWPRSSNVVAKRCDSPSYYRTLYCR